MKAKKFDKKLALNKKTVADLSNFEMGKIQGGGHCPPTVTVCQSKCGVSHCE